MHSAAGAASHTGPPQKSPQRARRAFTASDSTYKTPTLSSQPMQASVILWP